MRKQLKKIEASDGNQDDKGEVTPEEVVVSESETFDVDAVEDAYGCANGFVAIGDDILKTASDMTKDEALANDGVMTKMDSFEKLEKKCRNDFNVTFDQMKECNDKVEIVAKDFGEKFQ